MSTPPGTKTGTPARPATPPAAAAGDPAKKRPPLADRLPDMTDKDLLSLQTNAARIAGTPKHPKQAAAEAALPGIEAEIGRRAAELDERKALAAAARTPKARSKRATVKASSGKEQA